MQQMATAADSFDPLKTTLLTLSDSYAARTPTSPFLLVSEDSYIDYASFQTLTQSLLPPRLLALADVVKEPSRIMLIARNSLLVPLLLWSAWSIGICVALVPPTADASLWLPMAQLTQPSAVFVMHSIYDEVNTRLAETGLPIVILEQLLPPSPIPSQSPLQAIVHSAHSLLHNSCGESSELSITPLSPLTPNIILFTSSAVDASTLKCVEYNHSMCVASSWRTVIAFGGRSFIETPKRHLGWLPLSHCFELTIGLMGIVLRSGGTYIFHDPLTITSEFSFDVPLPNAILESLKYHWPIHSLTSVPAVIESMITLPNSHLLKSLSSLCVAGAASPSHLVEWAVNCQVPYLDLVGATEVAGALCMRKVRSGKLEDGFTLCHDLMGVLEKARDSNKFGELIIMGKILPLSYFRNTSRQEYEYDATSGVTTYRTGDIYEEVSQAFNGRVIISGSPLPKFSEDHMLRNMHGISYLSRADDVLVFSTGIKLDVIPLERALGGFDSIKRAALVLNNAASSIIMLIEPASPDTDQLPSTDIQGVTEEQWEAIQQAVAKTNSMLPYEKRMPLFDSDRVVLVDSLPVTTKLTLHRKKLKSILANNQGLWPLERRRRIVACKPAASPSAPVKLFQTSETKANSSPQLSRVREMLVPLLASIFSLPVQEIQNPSFSLVNLGLTSISSVRLSAALKETFSVSIAQAVLFGIRNIDELTEIILRSEESGDKLGVPPKVKSLVNPSHSPQTPVAPHDANDIVITGASCCFPGGIQDLEDLWQALLMPKAHLEKIVQSIPPVSRWSNKSESKRPYDFETSLPMAYLQDENYDVNASLAAFFGLKPVDVEAMPPNHRLVMMLGYKALEDAGVKPKNAEDNASTEGESWAVFTSLNSSGWGERKLIEKDLRAYGRNTENFVDENAGARLSYFLNLSGPAIETKTACSSSAVALHQAEMMIRNGDCDAAVVVASCTHFLPSANIFRDHAGIGSHSGRCATFFQSADGFLPSEGAAAIVIQRAKSARVMPYAKIRAIALGQDGRTQNFAAPSEHAQARTISKALKKANLRPDSIDYYESHGTGTRVGDAIEVNGINRVFGNQRSKPLPLGSIKAVIGHTEEVAALAGVLKAILLFKHNLIPPQPDQGALNEQLDLFSSKLHIPRTFHAFVSSLNSPRLASVASYGLSGTLANVILESLPQYPQPENIGTELNIFVISAHSTADWIMLLDKFSKWIDTIAAQQVTIADVCRTTQISRDHHRYRKAWVISSWRDLYFEIKTAHERTTAPNSITEWKGPKLALWFGPVVSSVPAETVFISHPVYQWTLSALGAAGASATHGLYVSQLCVAAVLKAMGADIIAVGGEGVGEFVAASFANVFEPETLFSCLTDARSVRQLVYFIEGSDVHERVEDLLLDFGPTELHVMWELGPDLIGVTGQQTAIVRLEELLSATGPGLKFGGQKLLDVGQATIETLSKLFPSKYPIISASLGGEYLDGKSSINTNYWGSLLSRTMHSRQALEALTKEDFLVVDLTGTHRKIGNVVSLYDNGSHLLAELWEAGMSVEWENIGMPGRTTRLPGYQWASNRCSVS